MVKVSAGWFLLRPFSLACRQLSYLQLHMVFPLCVSAVISCKNISYIGLGPAITTSFNLNRFFKGHISKYSHTESQLQHVNLWGHNSVHNKHQPQRVAMRLSKCV